MKSNIPHKQRKSYKKWALTGQRIASSTSPYHYRNTINRTSYGQFGNSLNRLFGSSRLFKTLCDEIKGK
jgi:hypothetical protein